MKKDKQYNNQKKKDKQYNNQKKQDKQYNKEKDKRTNNDIQNATQKTKNQATRIHT